jgi:tetratricopeptide (TPR) repeat protein
MTVALIILFGLAVIALIWGMDGERWYVAIGAGVAAVGLFAGLIYWTLYRDSLTPDHSAPWQHYEKAMKAQKEGDEATMLAELNAALAVQPSLYQAALQRARIHQRQGRHEAAVADYSVVVERAPATYLDKHGWEVYNARSQCLRELNRFEESRSDTRKSFDFQRRMEEFE